MSKNYMSIRIPNKSEHITFNVVETGADYNLEEDQEVLLR